MAMKFNYVKKSQIVYCVVDNTNWDISGWAKEISINLTDQFIFKACNKDYDVWIDQSVDTLLREVSKENFYTHAVLIATGTSLKLNDKLFSAVEEFCKNEFSLAGHILDRKEEYYEVHHQFFIVNLLDYKRVGMPLVGQESKEHHTQIEPIRSNENVHDDYVPLWVKQGTLTKEYQGKKHGWNLISQLLANNKVVIDIGKDIRNYKSYLYYEYDHVFMRELPNLYYYQFFGSNFVPSTNSDLIMSSLEIDGPVEQYITIGTGFNWINNLTLLNFTTDTTVIFTDVNPRCLEFMEKMVTTWDGENYGAFYKEHVIGMIPAGSVSIPEEYFDSATEQWEKFKTMFSDWSSVWSKIKSLKYKFVLVNYVSSYNLNWIEPCKRTVFNISDVFTYTPFTFITSLKYRIACENRLINSLKEVDENIHLLFSTRASDSYKIIDPGMRFGKVKHFDLTDINRLKTAPWHVKDWPSPRMLG